MARFLPVFLVALLAIAIVMAEDYLLILVYLFGGAILLGKWWGNRIKNGVVVQRAFNRWAFLGEKIQIKLKLKNQSILPIPWLQVRESLPTGLHSGGPFQDVIFLPPKAELEFSYPLECVKRGYYQIGPLNLFSGDVLGVSGELGMSLEPDYLTVFPKIITLSVVKFPSASPMGTLRHTQPIFEDPTRIRGKRDYVAGDSLRRIDWKATATTGRMQVKLYEPSIALETVIFLNLNAKEYDLRTRFFDSELAIIVAASLANWVSSARQSVGLATNGADPLAAGESPPSLIAGRGRAHLLRLLELLARLQMKEGTSLVNVLNQEMVSLPWGTTLILVTGKIDEALFDAMFRARQSGLKTYLVQCGQVSDFQTLQQKARQFGIPLVQILREQDLDIWRH